MLSLIKGQEIIIDCHDRVQEFPFFDDKTKDIHLDKKKTKISFGKKRDIEVDIKIPLNTDNDVTVKPKRNNVLKKNQRITQKDLKELQDEIQEAFKDKKKRAKFIHGILNALENYKMSKSESDKDKLERYKNILLRIASTFGLNKELIVKDFYQNKFTKTLSLKIRDDDKAIYKLSVGSKFIYIGEDKKRREK